MTSRHPADVSTATRQSHDSSAIAAGCPLDGSTTAQPCLSGVRNDVGRARGLRFQAGLVSLLFFPFLPSQSPPVIPAILPLSLTPIVPNWALFGFRFLPLLPG